MGAIACAMLLVGGLVALQQAAVLGAVPFTFVVVGVAWCWIKALREETQQADRGPEGVAGVPLAKVPADTTDTERPGPDATPGTGPGSTGPGT
jgi:choline-glycine betaine transporter